MPFDGSGNFVRGDGTRTGSTVWQQARDASVKIVATGHDAHDEDIASGLENCVTRDGQNSPSADLPMATFKHTGVGNAAARNSYAAAGQVQDSSFLWGGTTGGTSTAYTISVSPPITAYVAGQRFAFKLNATCGANPTLNINGVGAVALKSGTTPTALGAGALLSGQICEVLYDGTQFVSLHGLIAEMSSTAVMITGGNVSGIVMDGNWIYSGTRNFTSNTSDGSDNQAFAVGGGGAAGTTRGGTVAVYGNENANTGKVVLTAGNVTNGTINFETGGALKAYFDQTGNLQVAADDTYEIGASATTVKNIYLKRRTWIPTIGPGGFTPILTYARYTRIGGIIFFTMRLVGSSAGVSTVTVTLPSTSASLGGSQGGTGTLNQGGVDEAISWAVPTGGSATLTAVRASGNFTGTSTLIISGQYEEA